LTISAHRFLNQPPLRFRDDAAKTGAVQKNPLSGVRGHLITSSRRSSAASKKTGNVIKTVSFICRGAGCRQHRMI
jgi:hypothetical protein